MWHFPCSELSCRAETFLSFVSALATSLAAYQSSCDTKVLAVFSNVSKRGFRYNLLFSGASVCSNMRHHSTYRPIVVADHRHLHFDDHRHHHIS